MTRLTRRRFLSIAAAAGVAATLGTAARAAVARWRGIALGAPAEIRIRGLDQADAAPLFGAVEGELRRLEAIFSLYRPDSALTALNRTGRLVQPPPEMIEVLTLALGVHGATGGLFDPTVQPLFQLYAEAATSAAPRDPDALRAALQLVGFDRIQVDAAQVVLGQGQRLTLNGIAQGYLTDRIALLLRDHGLVDVMVDMGEILARGRDSWPVRIAGTSQRLSLRDRGIATSAPLGTLIDPSAGVGHILDPRRGWARAPQRQVSVVADTAALADALSTAAVLMDGPELGALSRRGFGVFNLPA